MSDFDKEAEREKLREKYGEEEEKRAATEQMSELLLKGATMTNAHCTDCGDPIFRYDGQEFCPTCQKPITREPAEDGDAEQGDHIEVADPSDDATVQFGGDGADTAEGSAGDDSPDDDTDQPEPTVADESTREQPTANEAATRRPDATHEADQPSEPRNRADRQPEPGRRADQSTEPRHADQPSEPRNYADQSTEPRHADQPSEPRTSDAPAPTNGDNDVTAELSAAESVLAETVHRFACRAAETDDPRRARDHLAAAREAAEALDAVRF